MTKKFYSYLVYKDYFNNFRLFFNTKTKYKFFKKHKKFIFGFYQKLFKNTLLIVFNFSKIYLYILLNFKNTILYYFY
jgi:hypothetical protein